MTLHVHLGGPVNVHVHSDGGKLQEVIDLVKASKGEIMADLAAVKAAIEQAKADITVAVATEVDQVTAAVQALKDALASGSVATAADLDELIAGIQGIKTAVAPAVDSISDKVV